MTQLELDILADRLNILREQRSVREERNRDDPALIRELLEGVCEEIEGTSVKSVLNPLHDIWLTYVERDDSNDPDGNTILYSPESDSFRRNSAEELMRLKRRGSWPKSERIMSDGSWAKPLLARNGENTAEHFLELVSNVLDDTAYKRLSDAYERTDNWHPYDLLILQTDPKDFLPIVQATATTQLYTWLGEMHHELSEMKRLGQLDELSNYLDPVDVFLETLSKPDDLQNREYETAIGALKKEWTSVKEIDETYRFLPEMIEYRLKSSRLAIDEYEHKTNGSEIPNLQRLADELEIMLSIRQTRDPSKDRAELAHALMQEMASEFGASDVKEIRDHERDTDVYELIFPGKSNTKNIVFDALSGAFGVGGIEDVPYIRRTAILEKHALQLNREFELRQYSISGEYSPNQLVRDIMEDVAKRIGGFGVEGIVDCEKGIDCYYVNQGDPYKQTILFTFENGGFTVGSWGDYIERKELEYEKERKERNEEYESEPETSVEMLSGVPVAEIEAPVDVVDVMPSIEEIELPNDGESVKSILDEIDWPKPRSKVEQFRQDFTKNIIELMERGEAFWQQPWKTPEFGGLPVNAITGKRYNGINVAYLMDSSQRRGFTDPRWMTFLQAKEAGYHVNAGESGTKIEFYGEYDPKETKKGREQRDERIQRMRDEGASESAIEKMEEDQPILFVKTYTVFNAQQVSGIEPLEVKIDGIRDESEVRYHERAEKIMANCGVPFLYGNYYAAYNPLHDVIKMPERTWFNSDELFYSTALHEVAHSTGHSSRMSRELIHEIGGAFGTPEYAMEELRAEMASAFLVMELGIVLKEEDARHHTQQHAAYTKSWLSTLKDDYKEFFKATRDAVNIADYVMAYEHVHEKSRPDSNAKEELIAQATAAIGGNVIITSAERGKSYTGEIVAANAVHAVQKIAPGRGIVHNFMQIDLSNADEHKPITISYDRDGNGRTKEPTRDEELVASRD